MANIICKNITKSFKAGGTKVVALNNVSLAIAHSSVHFLVGPSGCGKTTLLSVLAAILTPDSGECLIDGRDITKLRSGERALFRRDEVGFVFQSFNLIPTLSVMENVSVPILLQKRSRSEACKEAAKRLEMLGLGERVKERPGNLSGGQQQRVAIARALVHHPKIIVCDEPTSALDHENGNKVMELFRQSCKDEGATLIVVTHDTRILKFADEVSHMNDGRIVTEGEAHG